ncbi:TerD family protein [Streptomyces millisiae]|uniref:TerD family protein n=1 Tax=Streptomyces millisiae TaxID=3075542 RepID=A0ABU2LJ70_9ACTN|nr:TerD family protein [Streptomyces sp. DSM 44918]MDT0317632.1 TerD family protein [Streptomyces sp. DSM 44918]
MGGASGGASKGIGKVEVAVRWDPAPLGAPALDVDLIGATYRANDPHGQPAYLVHFDSRSPDGTITLSRDSRTGQGFGYDEVIVLELDRLAPEFVRVVVGVAVQQRTGRVTFGDLSGAGFRVREGYTVLAESDFEAVAGSTAATVAEFTRDALGAWSFHAVLRGFDADPDAFTRLMGGEPAAG